MPTPFSPYASRRAALPAGNNIVNAARNQVGSLGYKTYRYSNATPSGVPKDHHFIADTLDRVGIGFGDKLSDRPSIADWANPTSSIPGWQPVMNGSIQPGDVLATTNRIPKSWYNGGGQQLGIATGNGTSIGIVDNDRIGENQFGFQPGHDPLVWRSTQMMGANAAALRSTAAGPGEDDPGKPGEYPFPGGDLGADPGMPTFRRKDDIDPGMPVIQYPFGPRSKGGFLDPKAGPTLDGIDPKMGFPTPPMKDI